MKKQMPKPEESGGSADWMTTYSDMVTLLFTFFVLLFAISQVDVQKFNLLAASLSNKGASPEQIMEIAESYNIKNTEPINVEDPRIPLPVDNSPDGGGNAGIENVILEDTFEILGGIVSDSADRDKVSVSLGDGYIFIRFVDDMLFSANSSDIRPQDYELLKQIGNGLKRIENDVGMIRIDGHTAAIPEMENYPVSDRDLSSARANAVLKYFETISGIRGDKLATFAFGKYRPIADNNTEAGRAQNRRIEIVVTHANSIDSELDSIYENLQE